MLPDWLKLSKRSSIYKQVFETPEGQFILADLKKFCHIDRSTFYRSVVTGQADPYAMAHAEGKRAVMREIMKMANLSYEDILRLRDNEEALGE